MWSESVKELLLYTLFDLISHIYCHANTHSAHWSEMAGDRSKKIRTGKSVLCGSYVTWSKTKLAYVPIRSHDLGHIPNKLVNITSGKQDIASYSVLHNSRAFDRPCCLCMLPSLVTDCKLSPLVKCESQ